MIRQNVKSALQTVLQGVSGVKSVFTTKQKQIQNQQMPAITIYLPQVQEKQLTSPAPLGRRQVDITVLLEILMVDPTSAPETGDATFDNLLDSIDVALRASYNLGGLVLASAIKNLETKTVVPQEVAGQNIFRVAYKKFDVSLQVVGTGG